jgi:antitoxin (DNA-binding transcriptional repressor) of toxin-antitoxin stability system
MSDSMKSITLRTLVREPLKVKRLTRAGNSVHVTDNGRPLWVIQPATPDKPARTRAEDERRRREIEDALADVLREPRSKVTLSKIVLESRR